MKEFFGFGGYTRPPEGFLSWQHLTLVTAALLFATLSALWLGKKYKSRKEREKNRIVLRAAILMDSLEIIKIVMGTLATGEPGYWLHELPLFLCSIQLITLPLAALSKGRLKAAAMDFIFLFGPLGALLGTYGAGNIFSCYPILSYDILCSVATHSIAGFAAVYIGTSGLLRMEKRDAWITVSVLFSFSAAAMLANHLLDYNYMFLVRGDGTPYDILYNLVGGHPILYPAGVILLFLLYISAFYLVFHLVKRKKSV